MSSNVQAVPPAPTWCHASSGTKLKRLIYTRIDNFFSFDENRSRFPDQWAIRRNQRKELGIHELLSMVVDTLKLRSVKDTKKVDVSNAQRYVFLLTK